MKDLVKVLFFVIAGIFFISYVQDAGIGSIGFSGNSTSFSAGNTSYTRSYDTNDDGVVSDWEYRQGEKDRIEDELKRLRRDLARTLSDTHESPYADFVTLSRGNTDARNPDKEYVEIAANYSNKDSVIISEWTLQSLASGKTATIHKGIPPAREGLSPTNEYTIKLIAGKKLFVISGDQRSRTSFVEDTSAWADKEWIAELREDDDLWDDEHDAVVLFDANGLVVDYISY